MNSFLKVCLFGLYLLILFWILFVKVGNVNRVDNFHNPQDHLIPFRNTTEMFKTATKYNFKGQPGYALSVNILGNIILFLPWGFLMPEVFKRHSFLRNIIISCLLISFSVELLQHLFSVGVFDIDDIIYNTLGGIIGFNLYLFK